MLACVCASTLGLSACGGDEFANEPRPPAPLSITGVITDERITISPNGLGAGPILLTISNQTSTSQRVTLEGEADDGTAVREDAGPINPQDTATIQQTLPPGSYRVKIGTEGDLIGDVAPGRIEVGAPRSSSSDELELP